ncbi:MAG: kinase/pyrophosphorylase [Rhodocyclaceae bacterium]|nr:kinase/pyrophosphorylase [Rhodocyclaceae bacterium]
MPIAPPHHPDAKRTVFIISDGTGITAETLAHSLLSQFEGLKYRQVRIPFVDSLEKTEDCVERIAEAATRDGAQPIVVSTLVNATLAALLRKTDALVLDFFAAFIAPLEGALGLKSTHTIGRTHSSVNTLEYAARIDAINFTMAHDDGVSGAELDKADVILVGVSRSGKTPTSLYLALQFGIRAANYPLIPEDFERGKLPDDLRKNHHKLFGLTISAERLASIRQERRPDSHYASVDNCRWEIDQAQKMMRREGVRWLDSTTKSIEEIAATLMQAVMIDRRAY